MLKSERLKTILQVVKTQKFVTVDELARALKVSDMTIRRDLNELHKANKILRIHGGAQLLSDQIRTEKSYQQKREIHSKEKYEVAKRACNLIHENDSIYVGPGTTLELLVANLKVKHLRIVTNSLPVFEAAKDNMNDYDLIMVGGSYRRISGAFVGALANNELKTMSFSVGFVGVNGINDTSLTTANLEEGQTEGIGLDRSQIKFVVADYTKLDHSDFHQFYDLRNVDGLITNHGIEPELEKHYSQFTTIYK
ncbi:MULTISPECIES: DeoR/GlpR family DNA-binding transcription regulator [Lactobacillus]|uniref:Lactose phosphotransferase system repressor n=1 Tax=Lactobacillus melliventris TaxID=1218507 RepID=A0ABX5MZX5_9LACO|nr:MULTISPECIES: DeoR/GlpR family DNA-binding transcription regulator [Lactobacillus]MBH9990280.1 DeoR/GlpR transcriptional regulator [Lactobacillus sp. M0392]MBI0024678.1 DeoR/GlpR transcriptional regulator [Lactobacillus sp. W8171]MBI0045274.1 DeoR/GlpR transcriptional regulator [Lactobacillus sp. M0393]PXY84003.1 DeoR family transcriptional regulator [Lactobacillus melliventris]RMC61921.1 DeoR/GlpR transcriptional regulator [Lactobacillus sp. ESL0259]